MRFSYVVGLSLLFATPLAAQLPPTSPRAFRTSIGITRLFNPAGSFLRAQGVKPSLRATISHNVNGALGLELGYLRVAGGNLFNEGSDGILTSPIGGLRLNMRDRNFRPYWILQGGIGSLRSSVDLGGYTYSDASGTQTVSRRRTVDAKGYVAAIGVGFNWIFGPGVTLEFLGGMNAFYSSNSPFTAQEREQNNLRGSDLAGQAFLSPHAGFGLRFTRKDNAWYRKRLASAQVERAVDQALAGTPGAQTMVIQVEEPREWAGSGARGIKTRVRNSIRVVGTARDVAGVREVRINGKKAALQAAGSGTSLVRFTGYVPVDARTKQVEISGVTVDGRQAMRLYTVEPQMIEAALKADSSAAEMAGRRFAVVIGISNYADSTINDLKYADDDALAFYEFLRSPRAGLGGIPKENIQLLLNEEATYRNIRTALFTFLQSTTENDVIYIYIAGHGVPDPKRLQDLYLLPHDAELRNIPGTGVPMTDVNDAIRKVYARHVVLLTDACHSGGVSMGGFAGARAGDEKLNLINAAFLQDLESTSSGLAILTASEARQLSQEAERWGGGHGVFTYYLLEGLKGAADEDADRIVRLGEVMEYVREQVRRETANAQIPAIGSQSHDRYLPVSVVVSK